MFRLPTLLALVILTSLLGACAHRSPKMDCESCGMTSHKSQAKSPR